MNRTDPRDLARADARAESSTPNLERRPRGRPSSANDAGKSDARRLSTLATLRQTRSRDWPETAIRVQKVDVQCVLQFTLLLALSCVLHRLASRVIHRRESS